MTDTEYLLIFSQNVSAAIPENLTFCFPGNFSVKKLYIYIVVVVVVKRVVNDRQEMNCTLGLVAPI